jgi:hypothetical protein
VAGVVMESSRLLHGFECRTHHAVKDPSLFVRIRFCHSLPFYYYVPAAGLSNFARIANQRIVVGFKDFERNQLTDLCWDCTGQLLISADAKNVQE